MPNPSDLGTRLTQKQKKSTRPALQKRRVSRMKTESHGFRQPKTIEAADVVKPRGASEDVEDSEEEKVKANQEEMGQDRRREMGELVEDADDRTTKDNAEQTGKHAVPVVK